MGRVRDQFVDLVLEGSSDRATLEEALRKISNREGKRGGAVEKVKEKAKNILVESIFKIMKSLPVLAVHIGPAGTGVEDIPSPACMEEHLPKDRKWTKADIEQAWEICLSDTSK